MPTSAERNALMFLAAVAVVGGGARVISAARFEHAVGSATASATGAASGDEVALQIAAVDSARAARSAKASRASRTSRARSNAASPRAIAGGGSARVTPLATIQRSSARSRKPTLSQSSEPEVASVVDVNSATMDELQRLPRVGPAIAARIIEYRDEHGALGGLDDLRHVRGIGVTTAARLAPLVTFSSGYRLSRSETRPSSRDRIPPYD